MENSGYKKIIMRNKVRNETPKGKKIFKYGLYEKDNIKDIDVLIDFDSESTAAIYAVTKLWTIVNNLGEKDDTKLPYDYQNDPIIWLTSYRIIEKGTNNPLKDTTYSVLFEESQIKPFKQIVFHDGQNLSPIPHTNTIIQGVPHIKIRLDIGDPSVGITRPN